MQIKKCFKKDFDFTKIRTKSKIGRSIAIIAIEIAPEVYKNGVGKIENKKLQKKTKLRPHKHGAGL